MCRARSEKARVFPRAQQGGLTKCRRVDASPSIKIASNPRPEKRHRLTLENDNNKRRHHLQDVPREQGIYRPPNATPVATKAKQEHQHGAFRNSENGVVDELRCVVPDDTNLEVRRSRNVCSVHSDEHLLQACTNTLHISGWVLAHGAARLVTLGTYSCTCSLCEISSTPGSMSSQHMIDPSKAALPGSLLRLLRTVARHINQSSTFPPRSKVSTC